MAEAEDQIIEREREVKELLKSVSPSVVSGRLRRVRQRMGLSIRELSSLSNVSKNSIVRIEKGGMPQVLTLLKLCSALGVHVASLLKPSEDQGQIAAVHRNKESVWYDLTDFGAGPLNGDGKTSQAQRKKSAAKSGGTPLLILKSRLDTGRILPTVIELYHESETRSHAGEEFVYVLEGEALVKVGSERIKLSVGESVTFWSAEEHSYAPAKNSVLPARVLSVRIDDRQPS